jgi:hypothetical protein
VSKRRKHIRDNLGVRTQTMSRSHQFYIRGDSISTTNHITERLGNRLTQKFEALKMDSNAVMAKD